MHSSRRLGIRSCLAAFAFVAPLAVSALASAETTCGDQVCPKNWECLTATATDGVACAPNTKCAPSETTTYQYCSPKPCTSDADCAADMVCYTETVTNCAEPTCPAGADCAATEPSCTPSTQSACVPHYVPPCETDSDCGTGFTCVPAPESCGCAGSAGTGGGSSSSSGGTPTPASDGGSEPAPPPQDGDGGVPASDGGAAPPSDATPPDCTCEPSTTKVCKLTVVACTDASDCPSGFTCEDNPETSCWASSDGTSGCEPANPPKLCAPPYTDLVGGVGHANDVGGANSGTGIPSEPPKGSGAPAEDATGASASPSATNDSSSGGCTIERGRGGTANTLALAAFAALAVFGLRRRRAA